MKNKNTDNLNKNKNWDIFNNISIFIYNIFKDNSIEKNDRLEIINNYLSSIYLPFYNDLSIDKFFQILDKLRKENYLSEFIHIITSENIKNNAMKNLMKISLLKELMIISEIKEEDYSFNIINYIIDNFIYKLTKKEDNIIIHFFELKIKKNKEYLFKIINIIEENISLNKIYLLGLILGIKNLDNSIKEKLSKLFINYFCENILSDNEKNKNLIKERLLTKFLKNVKEDYFYNNILNQCLTLLNRTSKNSDFIEIIFSQSNIKFSKEFTENVFKKFKEFFYPKYEIKDNLNLSTFHNFSLNSDHITLLNLLLEINFSIDKKELNKFSIFYLIEILQKKNSKNKNCEYSQKQIGKIINFILSKFGDGYNEDNKDKFEKYISIFIDSLIFNNIIENQNEEIEESEKKEIIDNLFNLLNNNDYSNFHSFFYLIGLICLDKFNIEINDKSFNLLKNNLKSYNNFDLKNIRNIFPLYSFSIFNGFKNNNFYQQIKNEMYNFVKLISESEIFKNNYNNISKYELISIYYFLKVIISKNAILNFEENNEDYNMSQLFLKNICLSLLKKQKCNSELIIFQEILNIIIENEVVSNNLIDKFFIIILPSDNDNLEKMDFIRLNLFLKIYTLKYINDEIEDSIFLKYIILCHLSVLNQNMNIKYTQYKRKNKFIEDLYKSPQREIIINKLESNIKTLGNFIFSDLGLFNITNNLIVYSCYSLIEIILKLTNKGKILLENSFGKLDKNKFIFIDNLTEYYNKNIDLIGKFDLIEIIKTLKENNTNYKTTYNWIKEKTKEQSKEKSSMNNQNKKVKNKNKKNIKDNKKRNNENNQNKKKQNEKEEEKYNEKEYKNYLIRFYYKNINNLTLILNRLKLIIPIFENTKLPNYRENLQLIIKKLWSLLKVDFCHELIKETLENLFKKNYLTKNFSFELSNLMYLEASNDKEIFNIFYDKYPNVIPNFNKVLNDLFKNKTEENQIYLNQLFETFDFIIIKILFYIVLNRNIGIDDTIESVENLISILTNLHLLNYDQISPLLLSLLKSDYTGENMQILLKLYFQNSNEENFINLCNEILNYEYISKYSFLKTVVDLNMENISKYQSLHNKIFIICFEENESLFNLAIKIMNKYNMIITEEFFDSDDFKNAFIEHKSKDIINKAIRALVHFIPSKFEKVLNIYMNFYEKEINDIIQLKEEKEREKEEEEEEENKENEEEENNENEEEEVEDDDIYPKLRINFLYYINECLDLFSNKNKEDIISFLLKVNDKENDIEMFNLINNSLKNLSDSITEENLIKNIYKIINLNIKLYSEKEEKEINSNNLISILSLLNQILIKTIHNQNFEKEKEIIFETLYILIQKIENPIILNTLFLNFSYISSDIKMKSEKILDSIFLEIKNTKITNLNKGKIYCLSGIIKSFSISIYKSKKIHDFISKSLDEKMLNYQKINSMLIINILFTTLKKSYEIFFVELFSKIYNCITSRENEIRESAQLYFKNLMKDLSGYAVNSIMPYLIRDLREMNWRGKVSNIEILGQFAFSTPKQLSKYIPKIIKEIIQILKDPHEKVQEISEKVLKDISSAIQNPEIVDISYILIDAISNPYDKSIFALEALLETKFYHKFDAPALALIIPILDYNLKGQRDDLKIMSSHILGSIQNLLLNPIDLNQYLDIIIPDLKTALFQSSPECRKNISKTIGNLCKNLGQNYFDDMIEYCSFFLEKESSIVELTGASQAYAEILVSFGKEYLDKKLPEIVNKIKTGNLIVKEGYLSVFVFLTGCLGEDFQSYFNIVFPLIIEGFSNEKENIRNVSTKIFEICIIFFARKHTKTLVEPLLNRFYDINWRIRNSSIALIKTLINNTGDEFKKESSEYFSEELRNKILSHSFILKGDFSGNTETIANMIWRDYVDNIPKYISKILKSIYQQLIIVLSDEKKNEVFEIGNQTVRLLASKFSDKLFNEMLPIIKENMLENKNIENIITPSLFIIYFTVNEISEKLLLNNKNKIIEIVNEHLNTNFSSSRKIISEIIFTMGKKLNDRMMSRILIYKTMELIRGKDKKEQEEISEIIIRLVELEQKEILNIVIGEIFKEPFEEGIIELLYSISDKIIEIYDDIEINNLYIKISNLFTFKPISCIKSFVGIDVKIDDNKFSKLIDFIEKISKFKEVNGYCILYYIIELINNFVFNYEKELNKEQSLFLCNIINEGKNNNDLKNNYNITIGNILLNTKLIFPASDDFDLSILNLIHSLDGKIISTNEKVVIYLSEYIIHLLDVTVLDKNLLCSCLSIIFLNNKENKNKEEIIKKLKELEFEENTIEIIDKYFK